jgi:sugar phosphate isomerase/epimerase
MPFPLRRAYHAVYDESLSEALDYASQSDWNGIVPDLGVPVFSTERYSEKDRKELKQKIQNLSLEVGIHAPGDDVSLYTSYPPIRFAVLEYFKSIIDFARDISTGPTTIVVHAGSPPSFKQAGRSEDTFLKEQHGFYFSILCETLLALMDYGGDGVNIALENFKWNRIVHDSIKALVPQGLKLCLDIPKLYFPKLREDDFQIFEAHKDAIEVVHVHDQDEKIGSHQVVGEGSIDFEPALSFLSALSTNPMFVFEVRPRNAAHKSLVNFGNLLDDYGLSL